MQHLLNYKAFNIEFIRATFARNEEGFYTKQNKKSKENKK